MKYFLLLLALLIASLTGNAQYRNSISVGLTSTDFGLTIRYGYMFNERLGAYIYTSKGRYPQQNILGIMDHCRMGGGLQIAPRYTDDDYKPVLNIGVNYNKYNFYAWNTNTDVPAVKPFDIEFGTSARIGRFYSFALTTLMKWECTLGVGLAF